MDSMTGMNMNMTDSSSNSTASDSVEMMMMKTYLHFTPGDTLIFQHIAPTTPAPSSAPASCSSSAIRLATAYAYVDSPYGAVGSGKEAPPAPMPASKRFILSHELSRGALAGLNTTLHYILMLVVMTFNAAYIISVILGVIVGETIFGRLHHH
ncbi:hypothetical protein B0H10DRAFT_2076867 [Mycena sp. CBHHK59/15]|nr:hypothetical protein B0H10DRAFT_2076867 [Mycena sp. CBHHK59/15]